VKLFASRISVFFVTFFYERIVCKHCVARNVYASFVISLHAFYAK